MFVYDVSYMLILRTKKKLQGCNKPKRLGFDIIGFGFEIIFGFDLGSGLDLQYRFGDRFGFGGLGLDLLWIWSSLTQIRKDLVRYGVTNTNLLYQRNGRSKKKILGFCLKPFVFGLGFGPRCQNFFLILPHPQHSRLLLMARYLTKSFGIWANDDQIQTYPQTYTTNPNPNSNIAYKSKSKSKSQRFDAKSKSISRFVASLDSGQPCFYTKPEIQ